jgi:hypothetical protein
MVCIYIFIFSGSLYIYVMMSNINIQEEGNPVMLEHRVVGAVRESDELPDLERLGLVDPHYIS